MTNKRLADIRGEIYNNQLNENDVDANPFDQFNKWMNEAKPEEIQKMIDYVLDEMKSGKDTFDSTYSKVFSLDKFVEGLMYYLQNMSGGKVIIKP